jgi:hypothetical protein
MTNPTALDLDEIAARAAALYEYATVTDQEGQDALEELTDTDVPALLAYVRSLRAELAAGRAQAWRDLADRADPAKPEVSWFGEWGHQVGEWIRKQAEYEDRPVAVPAAVETGE